MLCVLYLKIDSFCTILLAQSISEVLHKDLQDNKCAQYYLGSGHNHKLIPATLFAKTDHSAQILDIKLLVHCCSALLALCNVEVRIAVAYTVLE